MCNFFLLVIFVFLTFSCQRKSVHIDNEKNIYEFSLERALIQKHSIQLSMIGNEIEYIPLETKRESVLSMFTMISISDHYIFVTDRRDIHQFNRDGNHVRKIGSRGRGPGEFQDQIIRGINVNDILNQLIVVEHYTHVFNFDGKHIKQFRNDTLGNLERVLPWNNNQFIYYYTNLPKYMNPNEYSLIVLNEYGEFIKSFKNYHKRIQERTYSFFNFAPFYLFQNVIRFKEFGVDTLYIIQNEKFIPYAIFDLGNRAMPTDIYIPDFSRTDEVFGRYQGKHWLVNIVEDNDNFYLFFHNGIGLSLRGISQKSTSKTLILENNAFQNDIDGGLPFFPKYVYNDSILVDWIDAFDLREHVLNSNVAEMRRLYGQKFDDLLKLANSLDDESNPILVIVKK